MPPGIPASSAALLAGLPQATSAAAFAAAQMARLPIPISHPELAKKEEELHKPPSTTPQGPPSSEDRHVSLDIFLQSELVGRCLEPLMINCS